MNRLKSLFLNSSAATLSLAVFACLSSFSQAADLPPIGFYSVKPWNDATFEHVKSLGGNYIQTYQFPHDESSVANITKFMNLAEKHDLKVLFTLRGAYWVKHMDRLEEFKKIIDRFKEHPALGMWYLFDEPPLKTLSDVRKLYNILKERSPKIKVAVCAAWTTGWMKDIDVCDLLLVDNYPVADKTFPMHEYLNITFLRHAVSLARSHGGKKAAPILQAINWKMYPWKVKRKNYDVSKLRFPNHRELRYWLFGSKVAGADGAFFFSYFNGMYVNKNRKFFDGPLKMALSGYRELETTTNCRPPDAVLAQGVFTVAVWRKEGVVELLHESDVEENLSVHLEMKDSRLQPIAGTRRIKAEIADGELKIDGKALPWEVFAWRVATNVGTNVHKLR